MNTHSLLAHLVQHVIKPTVLLGKHLLLLLKLQFCDDDTGRDMSHERSCVLGPEPNCMSVLG